MLLEKNAFDMLKMKIFFKILFVWQENDLGFSSDFEKLHCKNNNITTVPFSTHTTPIKFDMIRVTYPDHGERVHITFMKQNNLCNC